MALLAGYSLTHMDEFADSLLTQERVCDIILPRLPKRTVLEELREVGPRRSLLLDVMEGRSARSPARSSSRSNSEEPSQHRDGSDSEDDTPASGSKSPSPSRSERFRSRSRSISADRE
jgi:pre-mRNA-splicing factor 38A